MTEGHLLIPDDPISEVHIVIPAQVAQFSLVRSIAAAMAILLNFNIDAMTDLRVAVDGINRAMVEFAQPLAQIHINFIADDDTISIVATIPVERNTPIDDYSRGWLSSQCAATNISVVDNDDDIALELTLDVRCKDRAS